MQENVKLESKLLMLFKNCLNNLENDMWNSSVINVVHNLADYK